MNEDLGKILQAFEDAVKFWGTQLAAPEELRKSIEAANVNSPVAELTKIVKLIKAHTTKVGIMFEPSNLQKSDSAPANTVLELSKSFVLFMSALAQLEPSSLSCLFFDEITSMAQKLMLTTAQFIAELEALSKNSKSKIVDKESGQTNDAANVRLLTVGKLWEICDAFITLLEGGKLKVLEKKTRTNLALIEDGLDEFAEWAEDPQANDDDPFGLDDDSSDEENDDVEAPALEKVDSNEEDKENLIKYCKSWVLKFKLIKLLFLSINKSLSTITAGSKIDQISSTESLIVREIDSLIVELMLNHDVSDLAEEHAQKVDKLCLKILRLLREANRNNETKVKWCTSWESKYEELSTSTVHT